MSAPRVRVDLQDNAYGFSVELSLQPLVDAWDWLRAINNVSRLAEDSPVYQLAVRILCPCCGATAVSLTVLNDEAGYRRACRLCRSQFPVEI